MNKVSQIDLFSLRGCIIKKPATPKLRVKLGVKQKSPLFKGFFAGFLGVN